MVQIIQGILRYYIHALDDPTDWEDAVPRIQFEYNNTKNNTTGSSPNEIALGFSPTNVTDVFSPGKSTEAERIPLLPAARIQAADAIALASMTMKHYYDKRRQPKYFKVGDRVMLRLHKGYKINDNKGQKMSQRCAGPFRVIERIGTLAYRLDLKQYNAQVHDVISIDHLEPAPLDTYARELPPIGPIRMINHPRERIIKVRISGKGKGKLTQYLVKYEGIGHEFNEWLTREELGSDSHLIDEFTRGKPQNEEEKETEQ
ncbi:hypothetical protein NUW58_g2044 [Xylaria curta]|nr:hypothetical protein NUW58_g2044 [Xylaria curta]